MKCAGCNNDAEFWVEVSPTAYQEHCKECMIDAMCGVPVKVIHMKSMEVVKRVGQSEVA